MKKVIFILLGMMTVLAACDKEESSSAYEITIASDETGIDQIWLIGYLGNGSRTIIGKGAPCKGGYKVLIDDPLPLYYLYKVDGAADFMHAPYFSNSTAMCYNAVAFFDAYKGDRHVGTFRCGDHIIYGDDKEIAYKNYWVKYIYVTDDVDITGTTNTEWGDPFQTFDLRFKKGWNAFVRIDYLHTSHSGYMQTLFASDIPAGMKWTF